MQDLVSPNGTCMLAPAGIPPSNQLFASGASVSWITDKEGLKILTVPRNRQANLWAPLTVFSGPLWLLIFCTSLLVGFVLWLFDQRARTLLKPPPKARRPKTAAGRHGRLGLAGLFRGRQHARSKGETPLGWQDAPATRIVNGGVVKEALVTKEDRAGQQEQNGFIDATGAAAPALAAVDGHAAAEEGARRSASCLGWLGVREGEEKAAVNNLKSNLTQSLLRLSDIGDAPSAESLPSRVVLWAYGLLLLILIAIYTANSAALLTARINSDIRGLPDLKGKAVGVWDESIPRVSALGVAAIPLPWENDKDEEQMLDMLRSGQLQALITTASFANWVASTQCEFETVGDQFAMTDYGIGYASKLSPVLRQSLDRRIAAIIDEGIIEGIYDVTVKKQGGGCGDAQSGGSSLTQVTPEQVGGAAGLLTSAVAGKLVCRAERRPG
ncbi:hypothetical protein MNEG_7245 [Monoraphidium neglectum]|uniref:Uncharacterized protein n=1 Tax=Monoraphidium neglectum TaxID=145388 RepID=A0A0D2MBX7_9CHLO|nr:hypothetical protein MNEG_7245 [Monoraphidium neglectum]KIZ00715.1 hypothetical protein MNEG_7245 [Monoraphidium neglectum]|eukprot:XP_013899734.1 hypothetical protein MNEG_7245 [Monoraphidium neglectum]